MLVIIIAPIPHACSFAMSVLVQYYSGGTQILVEVCDLDFSCVL